MNQCNLSEELLYLKEFLLLNDLFPLGGFILKDFTVRVIRQSLGLKLFK